MRITSDSFTVVIGLSFIRSEQNSDAAISEISEHISRGVKPHKRQLNAGVSYLPQWSRLRLLDGVLFRVYRRRPHDADQLQIVVPDSLVHGVLVSMHGGPTGGHFAADKLLAQVRLRFWWPNMVPTIGNSARAASGVTRILRQFRRRALRSDS